IDEAAIDHDLVVHVRSGGEPGRADEADYLALADALARLDAARKGRHMAVGGLVAVVVLHADVFAVAAFPTDLVHRAVARCENRGAVGGCPVDAGMHLGKAEDRMTAEPEAGAHDAAADRLAHQEFLRALAALVVVIDDAVV